MNSIEIWKDIKGYEGLYQVSNFGNVKSLERYKKNHSKLQKVNEKILKATINKTNGYVYVMLMKNASEKNTRVHKLVAEAFLPNEDNKPQINHIDGNKANNKVDNLEWCTCSENVTHAYKNRLANNDNQKIKIRQYDKQHNFIAEFDSLLKAAKELKISIGNISMCINNKRKTANGYIFERSLLWEIPLRQIKL